MSTSKPKAKVTVKAGATKRPVPSIKAGSLSKNPGPLSARPETQDGVRAHFVNAITHGREELKEFGANIHGLMAHELFAHLDEGDKMKDPGECAANIMLAYRHIEDARMRLGKVFEAMGEESPYNR